MSKAAYAIIIAPVPEDEGGGFVAYVPDLPGCMSDGNSQVEVVQNVNEAIDEWICEAHESGQIVPEPGTAQRHFSKIRAQMMRVIESQEELLEAKNELLAAQENLVESIERKSTALERALEDAQSKAIGDTEQGWFSITAMLEKNDRQLTH